MWGLRHAFSKVIITIIIDFIIIIIIIIIIPMKNMTIAVMRREEIRQLMYY